MAGIKIGNLPIVKAYFGNLPIDKIFYGSVEVYSSMPQLATPTISLSGDTLSIEEVENAEYYDIYVDGVLEESVPAVSGFNNITLTNGLNLLQYKLNDGQAVNVAENTSVVLNGVQKLEIYCENVGPIGCYVTVNGNTQYPDIYTGVWTDITSYLADNAVIEVYDND